MQNTLIGVALVLAAVGVGVAVYTLNENRALRSELEEKNVLSQDPDAELYVASSEGVIERLMEVETKLDQIDRERVVPEAVAPDGPTLDGRPEIAIPSLEPVLGLQLVRQSSIGAWEVAAVGDCRLRSAGSRWMAFADVTQFGKIPEFFRYRSRGPPTQ